MQRVRLKKRRLNLAFAAVAAAAFGAAASAATTRDDAPAEVSIPPVLTCEMDGWRYEFHVPTGDERLCSVRDDPFGLVDARRGHEDIVTACRFAVARRFGVADLQSLRPAFAESLRRLEALGYL